MTTTIGKRTGGLSDGFAAFLAPTLAKGLAFMNDAVATQDYLMGAYLTLADIQISYILTMASQGGMLAGHGALAAYLERLRSRPAFRKAAEVGGPMAPPR